MSQAAHQDNYPELPPTEQHISLRDEQGMTGVGIAMRLGTLGLAAALSFSAYHYGVQDGTGGVEAAKGSQVSLALTTLTPINWDCRALALYSAEGQIKYHMVASGKTLPIGTNVNVINQVGVKDKADKPTTIADSFCAVGSSKVGTDEAAPTEAALPVTITPVEGQVVNGYQAMKVEVPLESIAQNVQFVDKNMVQSDFNGTKILSGGLNMTGGAAGLACAGFNKLPFINNDCDKFGAGFTKTIDVMHANAYRSGENALLKLVMQKAANENWPEISEAYEQSYIDQAIEKAGGDKKAGEAVTVVFTSKSGATTPEWDNNVFDSLRKEGIIKNDIAKEDTSKIKLNKLPPSDTAQTEAK